jgi:general secretion pathway protein H
MRQANGFTLIELLIVMLIISIVAGIAVITINTNHHKQYETTAKQLVNTFNLAEQEAMLRPATIGFALNGNSFQFYEFHQSKKPEDNGWQPTQQAALSVQHIPDNMQITLYIHGERIPADGKPQLIITPSNDITPFVLLIGKKEETPYYRVIGKANGEVTSEAVTEE